eukprot:SM000046S16350  [mRNA]  locus=s46:15938:18961:- [translate_table: standard]
MIPQKGVLASVHSCRGAGSGGEGGWGSGAGGGGEGVASQYHSPGHPLRPPLPMIPQKGVLASVHSCRGAGSGGEGGWGSGAGGGGEGVASQYHSPGQPPLPMIPQKRAGAGRAPPPPVAAARATPAMAAPARHRGSPPALHLLGLYFDGAGDSLPCPWMAVAAADEPASFVWYHVVVSRRKRSASAVAQALVRVLCPPLKPRQVQTLVSDGPFCGTKDGALVLRISGAGNLASPFSLKLAARVTDRSIISLSYGPIPRLDFATAALHHGAAHSSACDVSATIARVEEDVLDFFMSSRFGDADDPIPTTISKLLVHILHILDSHVDHVQDIVMKQEMGLDDLEHALDEVSNIASQGIAFKKFLLKVQEFQKIHLDMQRVLQNIASGEQVFPGVRVQMAIRQLAAPEDLAAMELLVTRLHNLKENVGFLATRITALQINRRLYILSFLSVVFLPRSIVTGAFGMNVGGVPWVPQTDSKLHNGFLNVTYICIGIVVLLLLCFAASPLYTYVTENRQSHTARKRWHHAREGISWQGINDQLMLERAKAIVDRLVSLSRSYDPQASLQASGAG